MNRFPRHQAVDLAKFSGAADRLEAKYGLPRDVRFCRSCVISNQRPNSAVEYAHTQASAEATIRFSDDGLCDGRRAPAAKRKVNWASRDQVLRKLCDRRCRHDGLYDCALPDLGILDRRRAHRRFPAGQH